MVKYYLSTKAKLLSVIIGFLGFATACDDRREAMYGVPYASFSMRGSVIIQDGDSIAPAGGVEAILVPTENGMELPVGDTVRTNDAGEFKFVNKYLVQKDQMYKLKFINKEKGKALVTSEREIYFEGKSKSDLNADTYTKDLGQIILEEKTEE